MNIRFAIPSPAEINDDGASSQSSSNPNEYPEEDNNFEDWVSDQVATRPCRSLFDDESFSTAEATLQHDISAHGFSLVECCKKLDLDLHQRIRLINFIRKDKPTPARVDSLSGSESLFSSDEYLIPVVEDDPLLQLYLDAWSEDEDSPADRSQSKPVELSDALRRISLLEEKLAQAQKDLDDYRTLVAQKINVSSLVEAISEPGPSIEAAPRDDDSHYFQSYSEKDIHAVMIQDRVRTATYASFILKNPLLFKDAIVLDVGCGTGILSLFAAKSGAKHVYAVDASDIATKAERIVRDNALGDIITVIHGKVEEISLPDGVEHVDIIVSEWMGYALLYESMLDSVLHARDRFLRPGGVMGPSQCRMMLALCEGSEIHKDRIEFWDDIYGFDLSEMAKDIYDDAIVDVVSAGSVVSEPVMIKDLHLQTIRPRQLDFTSAFTLTCTSSQRTKIHALVLYFDAFFTSTGALLDEDTPVRRIRDGDPLLAEVWPVGGKPPPQRRASVGAGLAAHTVASFSTGPLSHPTHWKQTLFLLRSPILAEEDTVVAGTFSCRKSDENSRELDVEIHYSVQNAKGPAKETVVEMYKVR